MLGVSAPKTSGCLAKLRLDFCHRAWRCAARVAVPANEAECMSEAWRSDFTVAFAAVRVCPDIAPPACGSLIVLACGPSRNAKRTNADTLEQTCAVHEREKPTTPTATLNEQASMHAGVNA